MIDIPKILHVLVTKAIIWLLVSQCFVMFVLLSCASSPVYKTRVMAARAISPIVSKDQLISVLQTLTGYLTRSPTGGISQNLIHGALLQLKELTRDVKQLPETLQKEATAVIIEALMEACWIISQ